MIMLIRVFLQLLPILMESWCQTMSGRGSAYMKKVSSLQYVDISKPFLFARFFMPQCCRFLIKSQRIEKYPQIYFIWAIDLRFDYTSICFTASVYIYRHNTISKIVVYAKHEMVMSDMRQKCLLQPEMRRQGNNGLQI